MSMKIQLHKKLKGFELDLDFETKGKCTGILGASGCGKSMTLKCIAGLEKTDGGEVRLGEKTLFNSKQKINVPPQERKIGYLFQNYALFPHMTVEENISIGIKGSKKEIKEIVKQQIERFRLNGLEKNYPSQLSGGQQQRVALARILAYEPEVLLLDEPFSALDSFLKDALARELLEVLRGFKGDIIMVSHNRDELYTFCDQLIVMDSGRALLEGSTKEIFGQPRKMKVAQLTGCKNISPIKKLNSHELIATQWNLRLTTKERIRPNTRYVGVRAHDIKIIDPAHPIKLNNEADINHFNMQILSCLEFPFEVDYLVQETKSRNAQPLCCKFSKLQISLSKAIDIYIPPEALILLD